MFDGIVSPASTDISTASYAPSQQSGKPSLNVSCRDVMDIWLRLISGWILAIRYPVKQSGMFCRMYY